MSSLPPEEPPPVVHRKVWVVNLNTYLLILVIAMLVLMFLGVGVTDAGETW